MHLVAENVFNHYIRTHYECRAEIGISVPRITVWHHDACRVMRTGDPEGQSFYPITIEGLFILMFTSKECANGILTYSACIDERHRQMVLIGKKLLTDSVV